MREFRAAAVQVAPVPGPLTPDSIAANTLHALDRVRECYTATHADLIVLPESVTTGFSPGCSGAQLWDLISEVPGAQLDPYAEVAAELGIHLCLGLYRRGPQRGTVFNAAALIGPGGDLLGRYDKTHPFYAEAAAGGGWVTPGDQVSVMDTELGRIGMIICFDGDYPELSRILAVRGAEIILRPAALLRSADIWELTSRARAYDNHVYVIGANATGTNAAGVHYFGNSHIVTPIGHILAKAASHEGWVWADLDPRLALASLTPGSNIPQGFDHLRDRNLELIRGHISELTAPAETGFPH
ncbi:MAG: carbon-nitrogen hydrolase family protein [Austwickia sp.]|nr:carbon-nitrogen hydrolase family protein [Austwickia sp.]